MDVPRSSVLFLFYFLSISNTYFNECLHFIYPREPKILPKVKLTSYFVLFFKIDTDRRVNFNFQIVNFQFLSGNPFIMSYGLYIPQWYVSLVYLLLYTDLIKRTIMMKHYGNRHSIRFTVTINNWLTDSMCRCLKLLAKCVCGILSSDTRTIVLCLIVWSVSFFRL